MWPEHALRRLQPRSEEHSHCTLTPWTKRLPCPLIFQHGSLEIHKFICKKRPVFVNTSIWEVEATMSKSSPKNWWKKPGSSWKKSKNWVEWPKLLKPDFRKCALKKRQ